MSITRRELQFRLQWRKPIRYAILLCWTIRPRIVAHYWITVSIMLTVLQCFLTACTGTILPMSCRIYGVRYSYGLSVSVSTVGDYSFGIGNCFVMLFYTRYICGHVCKCTKTWVRSLLRIWPPVSVAIIENHSFEHWSSFSNVSRCCPNCSHWP